GAAQPRVLPANYSFGTPERGPVRSDAEEGHTLRLVTKDFLLQNSRPARILFVGQLRGRGRRARDQIGAAIAALEQLAFFRRRKQPVGKSGLEQSRPEPVAGSGKVMPYSRRIQSWIDPAKEQLQSARDHVRHGLPGGGEQFLFRWFAITHCV